VATTIYGTDASLPSWSFFSSSPGASFGSDTEAAPWDYFDGVGVTEYGSGGSYVLIECGPGSVSSQYVNRVWDPLVMDHVRWLTYYIDSGGQEYPGPSLWSVVSGSYAVEAIKFGRRVS